MKSIRLGDVIKGLALCVVSLGFGMMVGCAGTETGGHHAGEASDEYNSLPWSIPESWEGGGPMGGFGQEGR